MAYKQQPRVVRDESLAFPEQDYSSAEALMAINAAHQAAAMYDSTVKLFSGRTPAIELLDETQLKTVVEGVAKAAQVMQEVLSFHYLLKTGTPEERFREVFWLNVRVDDDGKVFWAEELMESPYSVHLMKCLEQVVTDCHNRGERCRWSVKSPEGNGEYPERNDFRNAPYGSFTAFIYEVGSFGDDDPYDHHEEILMNIIDGVCSLHLAGMRTKCTGLLETRSFDCALTEMWWHLVRQMDIGTVGICEACGRFYLGQPARGKKRKYCSAACRQWRLANPGDHFREREFRAY